MVSFALLGSSFIAGLFTFLAPCTLPLVPGYLGFISGVSLSDLRNPVKARLARRKIFLNGLFYVIGFSLVFIALGVLVGLGGAALVQYRTLLGRIGGVFIIIFGLYMMHVIKLPGMQFMDSDHRPFLSKLKPGTPFSSLVFGASFAFGWTPCVGPILGSILTLAATTATIGQGALLLSVFSLGLAIPFLLVAVGIGSVAKHITKISKYLDIVSVIGGIFLVFLGTLLVMNRLEIWTSYFFQIFGFVRYDRILDFL